MAIHESGQMYLETIYILSQNSTFVRAIDVGEQLGFTKPSVSRALSILKKDGYVNVDADGAITLTETGLAIAKTMYTRHTVLSQMLMELGVDEETATEDACRIEHVVDGNTASRMQIISGAIRHRNDCRALRNYLEEAFEFLGYAEREVGTVLPALPVGKHATVLKLGANIAEPQRLEAQGLTVGATVTVERLLPTLFVSDLV